MERLLAASDSRSSCLRKVSASLGEGLPESFLRLRDLKKQVTARIPRMMVKIAPEITSGFMEELIDPEELSSRLLEFGDGVMVGAICVTLFILCEVSTFLVDMGLVSEDLGLISEDVSESAEDFVIVSELVDEEVVVSAVDASDGSDVVNVVDVVDDVGSVVFAVKFESPVEVDDEVVVFIVLVDLRLKNTTEARLFAKLPPWK
jgi:hypothetical protein